MINQNLAPDLLGRENLMGQSLHIVHGVLGLGVGGLERLVLGLVRAAAADGHRVSVLCVESPGELASEGEAAGARIVSLGKPPGRHPLTTHRAAVALTELQPDVVHTHQIGAAWYLSRASLPSGRRIPAVHTEHGNHFARLGGWWATAKARFLFRRASRGINRFCCVSEEIAAACARWRTVPRSKIRVVPNGIPLDLPPDLPDPLATRAALGIPSNAPVIGTIGRLVEVKRQDVLLRATALLVRRFPELQLLLVGDGPERGALEGLARDLGMADRTRFLGYQPRPEAFLGIMSVFALTSRSEGLPVSLLEAWRAGVPVASSAVGGLPAVVADGETGLLFPPGDAAAAAAAIGRLLADPVLAGQIGRAGRRAVEERYTLDRMAATYEDLYRELLADNATGTRG
ncbi:glycosyltransferase family 4 protein [bacterium]|nr:glycosyltransferase family 4 protein [bacterium]